MAGAARNRGLHGRADPEPHPPGGLPRGAPVIQLYYNIVQYDMI